MKKNLLFIKIRRINVNKNRNFKIYYSDVISIF